MQLHELVDFFPSFKIIVNQLPKMACKRISDLFCDGSMYDHAKAIYESDLKHIGYKRNMKFDWKYL